MKRLTLNYQISDKDYTTLVAIASEAGLSVRDYVAHLVEQAVNTRQREPQCPYTHAHTRYWCGYDTCREG